VAPTNTTAAAKNTRNRAVAFNALKEAGVEPIVYIKHTAQAPEPAPTACAQDWDDLDAEDVHDPSMVTEYVDDIFSYLYKLEVNCTLPYDILRIH
jgi:hypothetical protein